MFQAQTLLLDFPPLPLPHGAPSPSFPSHGDTHCDPHLGGQSGRLVEQTPLTSYEPNVTAEATVEKIEFRVDVQFAVLLESSEPMPK